MRREAQTWTQRAVLGIYTLWSSAVAPNSASNIYILSSTVEYFSPWKALADTVNPFWEGIDQLTKTSTGNMLSSNYLGSFSFPWSKSGLFIPNVYCFNEHPVLTSFHTVFLFERDLLPIELNAVLPNLYKERLLHTEWKINNPQVLKLECSEFFSKRDRRLSHVVPKYAWLLLGYILKQRIQTASNNQKSKQIASISF